MVNFLGYGLQLAGPLLLILIAWQFGATILGDFLTAQAALLVLQRFLILGLDKGLLWWIAREEGRPESYVQAGQIFSLVALLGTLCWGIMYWCAEEILKLQGNAEGLAQLVRWMLPGIPLMALTEILLHIQMGRKKMGPQVLVKDTVVPLVFVCVALPLFPIFPQGEGLALAAVISQAAGLVTALWLFRKLAPIQVLFQKPKAPKVILHYSAPLAIGEISNAFLQRMDLFFLTFYVKSGIVPLAGAVGIYGIIMQFTNAIRTIRRSFDPIVLAIISEIGGKKEFLVQRQDRLIAGFNEATFLVMATQIPIFAFFVCFSPWLLGIYGPEFVAGTPAMLFLSGFWILNGVLGLCGIVVLGLGYSYFSLINQFLAVGAMALFAWWFIPLWGLTGAGIAVGAAYSIQALAQWLQARWVTGLQLFRWKSFRALMWGAFGAMGGWTAYFLSGLWDFSIYKGWLSGEFLGVQTSLWPLALGWISFMLIYGIGIGPSLWNRFKPQRTKEK
jgi:O-antigen/teichoic acid export membrane protein